MSSIRLKHSSGNSMSISAPATNPASDLELKLPATVGTANQVLRNSSTPGTIEFGDAGVANADMWQLSASSSYTASDILDLTANWVRSSAEATGSYQTFGTVGSAMSQSSGVFTFPSTGVWRIDFNLGVLSTGSAGWWGGLIRATKDNSSYVNTTEAWSSIWDGDASVYESNYSTTLFDVTNTSTHKVKFAAHGVGDFTIYGDNSNAVPYTWVVFTRLGDT